MTVVVICAAIFLIIYQPGRRYGPLEEIRTWKNLVHPIRPDSEASAIIKFYYVSKDVDEEELKRLALERLDALPHEYGYASVIILFDRALARKVSSAKEKGYILTVGEPEAVIISLTQSGGGALTATMDSLCLAKDFSSEKGEYEFQVFRHQAKNIWLAWRYKPKSNPVN